MTIQDLIQFNFHNLRAVFFDFDGVIIDSVPCKTDAFKKIMAPYGNKAVESITNFHLANGGIDRYVKIKHTLNECQIPHDAKLVNKLADDFALLIRECVLSVPLIKGVKELLNTLTQKKIDAFIVSGTPQDELKKIIAARHLELYFKEICGSPANKQNILMTLLTTHGLSPNHCLYIGDAQTDFDTAKRHGILFIGV